VFRGFEHLSSSIGWRVVIKYLRDTTVDFAGLKG